MIEDETHAQNFKHHFDCVESLENILNQILCIGRFLVCITHSECDAVGYDDDDCDRFKALLLYDIKRKDVYFDLEPFYLLATL